MEPYNRFLSSCTKTGGYEKSEDGEFPPTEGSPYIHPVRGAAYDLLALEV